jgi:hypothetical protein
MTSQQQHDRQQLEAATSRTLPPDAALDGETSAMRDGFIALGRAAETAGADYDEAALLARVQAACADDAAPTPATRGTSPNWSLLLSGALAAAALIAVARIAVSWPETEQVVVAPSAPMQPLDEPTQNAITNDSVLAWDDPLDDEIAAAESNLADLSGRWTGIDGSLSNMNQSLEALSDDLSDGSL